VVFRHVPAVSSDLSKLQGTHEQFSPDSTFYIIIFTAMKFLKMTTKTITEMTSRRACETDVKIRKDGGLAENLQEGKESISNLRTS